MFSNKIEGVQSNKGHGKESFELWGGVECTVNRVGSEYFNQLVWSGHDRRLDDLDRFAELGIQALRFPVLWEMFQPDPAETIDWTWADIRLERLRELGIRPIISLLHHGSGPPYTSLLDPSFPNLFAKYAEQVAQRYPWVTEFTPINEPMTTARFSGLYGTWYPHGKGNAIFLRAQINQCAAMREAMDAIRRIQPDAKLIQTEDYGRTYGRPDLAPLIEFLNHRRWLTPDLLCGRIDRTHPLWHWFLEFGITEAELRSFSENPCPPDVLGVNHYLTSDRFLDSDIHAYPEEKRAEAGVWKFVDIEAVRVCTDCPVESSGILREAWNRYEIPVALTEVHLGCSREEQMRWLAAAYEGARAVAAEGVDVRAITAWSLLGAYNWNVLVTSDTGYYEPGVFDLHSGYPRPTALARMLKSWANGDTSRHPVLDSLGWWQRPERIVENQTCNHLHPEFLDMGLASHLWQSEADSPKLLAILGHQTSFSSALQRACRLRGLDFEVHDGEDFESTGSRFWAVIDARESGTPTLTGLQFPCVVFRKIAESKHESPSDSGPLLIIETAELLDPWDESNILIQALWSASNRGSFLELCTHRRSFTYVVHAAHCALDLLLDGENGVWKIANEGLWSMAELVREFLKIAGFDPNLVSPTQERPIRSVPITNNNLAPSLKDALSEFLHLAREVWPELLQTRTPNTEITASLP